MFIAMSVFAVWNGTTTELERLCQAIMRNCECGARPGPCAAHKLVVEQRLMDHVLFVYRCRARFVSAEFDCDDAGEGFEAMAPPPRVAAKTGLARFLP
jgi:hypothetical protein